MEYLTAEEKRLLKTHVRNVGFWVGGEWIIRMGVIGKGL